MLDNVVGPIKSLQAVKNQPDQFKTYIGTYLSYEQHFELILLAATIHD